MHWGTVSSPSKAIWGSTTTATTSQPSRVQRLSHGVPDGAPVVIRPLTYGAVFTVTEAPLVVDAPSSISAEAGVPIEHFLLGTLSDPGQAFADPDFRTVGFDAEIDWGDGTPVELPEYDPQYNERVYPDMPIFGSHTYANAGTYTIRIEFGEDNGVASYAQTVDIAAERSCRSRKRRRGLPVTATEGDNNTWQLASFDIADLDLTTADFSATVSWRDNPTNVGPVTVFSAGDGHVVIAEPRWFGVGGAIPFEVNLTLDGELTYVLDGTALVANSAIAAWAITLTATEGQALSHDCDF